MIWRTTSRIRAKIWTRIWTRTTTGRGMTDQGVTAPGSGLAAPRIAYLGPAGTFSQAAVDRHFGPAADKLGVSSIDEVFVAVESGQAHYGVVPVENSTEGAVNYTQ